MVAKLTLGFPSRTAAVLALRGEGKTTKAIADMLDIEPKTVTALEVSATRKRSIMDTPPTQLGRAVLVSQDVLNRMRRGSSKRGIMTPNELARLIIETVVDNKLIDAVLDDAEDL